MNERGWLSSFGFPFSVDTFYFSTGQTRRVLFFFSNVAPRIILGAARAELGIGTYALRDACR
jgi:hypothetical protein